VLLVAQNGEFVQSRHLAVQFHLTAAQKCNKNATTFWPIYQSIRSTQNDFYEFKITNMATRDEHHFATEMQHFFPDRLAQQAPRSAKQHS
jgi:hypothetical protein